jgi:hypothetical protein
MADLKIFNHKSAPTLTSCCQDFIIRYTHHVIWRKVDPPSPTSHDCFKPADLKINCPLPKPFPKDQKDPKVFREHYSDLRAYFSDNLVRPVFDSLSAACTRFVLEHRLKNGDVLLSLVFQNQWSTSLQVTAKHVVYRSWTIREERTLHRTLAVSQHLLKLAIPGKADDRVLTLVAQHCPVLEELDIATSYVTDKGLYAICGVGMEEVGEGELSGVEEINRGEGSQVGQVCKETGNFVRAAKSKAMENIERVKKDPNYLKDIAVGSSAFKLLKQKFSLLTARMKPFIDKRLDPDLQTSWLPRSGVRFSFTKYGCKRLKKLDLNRTNFPKRSIDSKGDVIVDLGLTREPVLCALLLLSDLKILKWSELGEVLQLFEMIFTETGLETPRLNLTFLCDTRLTVEKLEVARRICSDISKLDISMFNFSFDEQEFLIGVANDEVNPLEDKFGRSSSMFFDFRFLRDLEVQYLDDSKAFNQCIKKHAGYLTRICLNKMISISFETLAAIKTHCQNLQVLEMFVDGIYTFDEHSTLEQVIDETPNPVWPSLQSLKVGGLISTGSVLKYLVSGCPNVRVLCYSPYQEQGDLVTDQYIEQLLNINPLPCLVAFYFEKCLLSEQTLFRLVGTMPNLRFVGILSEWYGLDRRGRIAIKAYINGNNLNVDVDSVQESYEHEMY